MFGIPMNYQNKELCDMLAREYVLGTMTYLVRKRFERLMVNDLALRNAVNALQNKFYPLYDDIKPVQPKSSVWHGIQVRLGFVQAKPKTKFGLQIGFWRNFAVFNLIITLALGVTLFNSKPESPTYLALLSGANQSPVLLAQASQQKREVLIQIITPQVLESGKSFELWLIQGKNAPQSLGLLPASGKKVVAIPVSLQAGIAADNLLAVSLEPTGGSPTHQPTGPVLFSGVWRVI